MPIEQISPTSSYLLVSGERKETSGKEGFLSMLRQFNAENLQGYAKGKGGTTGSPNLSVNWWPERFETGTEYSAKKLGLSVDEMKAKFANIIERAEAEGGFSDPKTFLKSLSSEDRDFLRIVQGHADPVSDKALEAFTEEAALNFFLPPGVQGDWDGDGLYQIGRADTFRFPSNHTPQHVKDAWEDLTKDMSNGEKMLAEGRFLISVLSVNIDSGKTQVNWPGDEGWNNPYSNPAYDYREHALGRLEWNEHIKGQLPEGQYQRDKEFWTNFIEALDRHQPSEQLA
ncbi:hypothetical protein KFE96_15015 [Kordiimonas sp. SCSIO 12603]|uniref:hypothetical protein n=1 Tax=Kordiimonas sp. SCSIO 12603 TaxID=2829596 RepID=UPI00210614C7|nr:hypothetical protein [Kordiimonas sp. SCSIO 12603]UTW58116.1 hypothetical protein KFE96_15015 [Kordiimonas sp. SCSIO 12603]